MWKERAKKLLELLNHSNKLYENKIHEIMLMFKEVHEHACEEQKAVCLMHAQAYLQQDNEPLVSMGSILNSPNAKFEE